METELNTGNWVGTGSLNTAGRVRKDTKRKWMWWFLGALAALQVYFVREMLAALALFTVVFAVAAGAVLGLYLLQKAWEAGMARVEQRSQGAVALARRGLVFADEVSRKPFRRPRSEPAR